MDALAQRAPAGAAALPRDVTQLYDGEADHAVSAAEAVVFDAELQLIALEAVLVTENAVGENAEERQSTRRRTEPVSSELRHRLPMWCDASALTLFLVFSWG